MSKKNVSKEKSIRSTKLTVELIFTGAILCAGAFGLKGVLDQNKVVLKSQYAEDTDVSIEVPTEADPNQVVFSSIDVPSADVSKGDLILVNDEHQYVSDGSENLVNINELNESYGITFFSAFEDDYTIISQAYQPMADLLSDYYNQFFDDTITIYGSYRTNDFQRQLYEADLEQTGEEESTRVAKPGSSEHETGLAFDLSETVNYDYNGEGDQAWINENCYHYGLILRYTEDKQDITGFEPESWHFRYVGIPHAYYITKNRLCLEEYIDLLRGNFPYTGAHLEFSDDSGVDYEVFWVPADTESGTTSVPVPEGLKYTISGNNVDGFIVTVYKNRPAATAPGEPQVQEETSAAEEDPAAETEEETAEAADDAESGDSEDSAE
ncbi:MAG: M15 family metallopeptidase [Ruminococcus sp.]|nr:M15 family metallopeptidase [Ruminococcus sp.]